MDRGKRITELLISSFVLAVSVYLLQVAYTSKIRLNVSGMNAMDFPKAILYALIVLCLYVILAGAYKLYKAGKAQPGTAENPPSKRPFQWEVPVSIVLIILYAIGWPRIGFILSSLVFVFLESRLLDRSKPWWHALAVAIGYTLLIYFGFSKGFGVNFPEPVLRAMGL